MDVHERLRERLYERPLVECIPNFSEGRDEARIDKIVDAVQSVAGVHVLDHSSDADHNRTVFTFIGEPEPVAEAAFQSIKQAAELINLDHHTGQHPRIGAADVVPFVPLRNASMAQCVQMAEQLGQRVGDELGLPVYLYEHAARVPTRVNLAEVRRFPYEILKTSIQSDPSRRPDFGPSRLGPAGAVAIGARGPLIAFNAYLATDDIGVAQAIARTVRESGGGLTYLKALGLLVSGQAQVSMNVIDYRQTGLHLILETVRAEASKHGTVVTHTELVGLVPRMALIDAALAYLGLPQDAGKLTLETRIGLVTGDFRDLPFE